MWATWGVFPPSQTTGRKLSTERGHVRTDSSAQAETGTHVPQDTHSSPQTRVTGHRTEAFLVTQPYPKKQTAHFTGLHHRRSRFRATE